MRSSPEFLGYPRSKGRAGVRNHFLVLAINGLVGPAAHQVAAGVPGAKLVASPYGRGQLGPDKDAHTAQLTGLGANPNVGAIVLLGADRETADVVAQGILARSEKPIEILTLDEVNEDALALSAQGIRRGGRLVRELTRARRYGLPLSELFVGIECGHSDATSGLAGNPLAGALADRIVAAGGTVVIGETLEWLGAEHVLARRAADGVVADAIRRVVERRETAVAALGVDLLGNNPGHENIRGGLSTIEEKSLGAIVKGGTSTIRSVLDVAEPPKSAGLHVMDGHGFSPESLTGFAAAGAQLMLFTTGPGNSFCSLLAPTVKISGNPRATGILAEQIDFDASALLSGEASLPDTAERLLDSVKEISSGTATWGEVFGQGAECFARLGASF